MQKGKLFLGHYDGSNMVKNNLFLNTTCVVWVGLVWHYEASSHNFQPFIEEWRKEEKSDEKKQHKEKGKFGRQVNLGLVMIIQFGSVANR